MTLYVPPLFLPEDTAAMLELVEAHAFGTLVSAGPGGLQVSHIPFLLDREGDGAIRLLGHVAVANPHAQLLPQATQVLAIFQGPHGYVSPGWYAQHPAVPTWNYAVVHAHCKVRMMDEAELHDLLVRLSNKYEDGRPKPWRAAELPAPFVSSLLPAITGFELTVERLEGKFKLSQNRPAEIPRVIDALEREGEAALAGLMRERAPVSKG
jgi:transcriptional regulator